MRIGPNRCGNRGEDQIRRSEQRQGHEEEEVVPPLPVLQPSPEQDGREEGDEGRRRLEHRVQRNAAIREMNARDGDDQVRQDAGDQRREQRHRAGPQPHGQIVPLRDRFLT